MYVLHCIGDLLIWFDGAFVGCILAGQESDPDDPARNPPREPDAASWIVIVSILIIGLLLRGP